MTSREQALSQFLNEVSPDDLIVSSTGKLSRELYELTGGASHFYMQGSMGCALPLALGLAMNTPKQVYCLTGDGSFLMKLGAYATYLEHYPRNLEIVIFDNGCHGSTGGQPTCFRQAEKWVRQFCRIIKVASGAREDLSRPKISCREIARRFRAKVKK